MKTFLVTVAALALALAAGPAPAADEKETNPYECAKVGNKAAYKLQVQLASPLSVSPRGTTAEPPGLFTLMTVTVTHEVLAKTAKELTLDVGLVAPFGGSPKSDRLTIDLTAPYDPLAINGGAPPGSRVTKVGTKATPDKVSVAGKVYDCTLTHYRMTKPGSELVTDVFVWTCPDAPVGVVKIESYTQGPHPATNGQPAVVSAITMELIRAGVKKP